MADKAGMIRWFLEELPGLRESGIINPDTEENLKGYYRPFRFSIIDKINSVH